MITAQEARERVNSLESERIQNEMKTVEDKINVAIAKGETSCWLGISISEATSKWLKSLDYKIRWFEDSDGCDVEVIW